MGRELCRTLVILLVGLSLAAAQTVGLVPPNARCEAVAVPPVVESLPVLGLSARDASRHCLTARAIPSAKPGAVVQRFRLPDLPTDEYVMFALWNHRRKPDSTRRTTVKFGPPGAPGGQRAQGYATVNAQGQVTGITMTNSGWGYSTAPPCTIDHNGYEPAPSAAATCVTAIGSAGTVTKVVITDAGLGYPPSVGNDVFDISRIRRFQLVYTQHTSSGPNPIAEDLLDGPLPSMMDSARCPCADPYAGECNCIPLGAISNPVRLACGTEAFVEVEAAAEIEYAIAAIHMPQDGRAVMPSIPVGRKTQFLTPLGAATNVKIDANGTDFLYRYVKELRVTVDTPLSANWFCDDEDDFGFSGDCAVGHRRLANITLDVAQFPLYHNPPHVWIDPPRKGILQVNVGVGGNYAARPTVSIIRTTNPIQQQVFNVEVLSRGRGYVRPPTVRFTSRDGFGSGAVGTATIDANGEVTEVVMSSPGNGYRVPPSVDFAGEQEVASITVRDGGSGYEATSPPIVVISAPNRLGGQTAQATASVDAQGRIDAITITNPGHGYEVGAPSVTFAQRVVAVTITNAGSGYTTAPTVTFTGGSCSGTGTIAVGTATINALGEVTGVTIDLAVFRTCTVAPTVTFDPSPGVTAAGLAVLTPGSGAVVEMKMRWLHDVTAVGITTMNPEKPVVNPKNAVLRAVMEREEECNFGGRVMRVEVIEPGEGYTTADTLSFTGGSPTVVATGTFDVEPGSSRAKATATIDGNKLVNTVTVTQAGSGYSASSPPAVRFFTTGRVLSVKVLDHGSGYTAVPTVAISGGGGYLARATATIANGRVGAITLTDPGAWYTSAPTVTITPRNEIVSITLTSKGSGYDPANPPLVWITSSGSGSGAKAVADVGPSGCLTGIRVTAAGSGYAGATTTVTIQAPGSGVTATASAVIGGGSGAFAIAIFEDGQGAEAVATVNTAGGISGIIVTKKGPNYGSGNPAPIPEVAGSGLTFSMELNAAGIPTGRVITKGTRSGTFPSLPSVTWSPSDPPGVLARAFLGSGSDDLYTHSGAMLRLVKNHDPVAHTELFPAHVTYTPPSKTFVFTTGTNGLGPQVIGNVPYYYLALVSPRDGSRKFFPNEEFVSNNFFGANNALNALFLPASVQVDVEYYPELFQKGLVSGSLAKDEKIIYQVSVPHDWSRIKLTYAAAEGTQGTATLGLRFMWTSSTPSCGSANSWCNVPTNGRLLRRDTGTELIAAPNTNVPPVLIEVSVTSCRGAATAVFDFTIEAEVTEYATEGECNSQLDCQNNPSRSHPTPGSRAGLSANGNQARFDRCIVDSRAGFEHNGICSECSGDCDCRTGQYCHFDNGMEYVGGVPFTVDPWSADRFRTCQRKDSVGDILGQPCRDIPSSALFQIGEPGRNTQQYCGKYLYYNDSYENPSAVNHGRGQTRTQLWTGVCHNHVCRECTSEGSSTCSTRRVCVDGFWQEKSGNSAQGAYAMAQTKTVKDAVSDGNAVTGSMLAFIVLIALSVGIGVFCMVRKGK